MRKPVCVLTVIITLLMECISVLATDGVPEISAPSALLMDYTTGKIIYEKNADEKRPLASVTKIMTMLLAMEEIEKGNLRYDDTVTGSEHAKSYGGSTIFLDAGEQMSVSDILKGIAIASGNDAAVAMGEHISGSEEAFVARMNQRCKELGMLNTHFVNSNGLDAEGHYSTARDIAVMSRELMKHEDIFIYTSTWMDSLREGGFILSNTNKLVKFYNGATGLKTGSTDKAGFCISATAKRENMHLIAVIMGAETSQKRQADASALLNYGFSSYQVRNVVQAENEVGEITVNKGSKEKITVKTTQSFDLLEVRNSQDEIETAVDIPASITAPVKKGDPAGVMYIRKNGEEISKIELVCADGCEKENFFAVIKNLCVLWLSL